MSTADRLGARALSIVLANEWAIVFTASDRHVVTCVECGAEFSNVMRDDPIVKHHDGCEVGAICDEARREGLA